MVSLTANVCEALHGLYQRLRTYLEFPGFSGQTLASGFLRRTMPMSKNEYLGEFARPTSSSRPIEIGIACRRCVAFSASPRAATTSGSCSRSLTAHKRTPGCFA